MQTLEIPQTLEMPTQRLIKVTEIEANVAWERMVFLLTRRAARYEMPLPKPIAEWRAKATPENRLIWLEIAAAAWIERARAFETEETPPASSGFLDALKAGGPKTRREADACNSAMRLIRLLRRLVVKGCIARGEAPVRSFDHARQNDLPLAV